MLMLGCGGCGIVGLFWVVENIVVVLWNCTTVKEVAGCAVIIVWMCGGVRICGGVLGHNASALSGWSDVWL